MEKFYTCILVHLYQTSGKVLNEQKTVRQHQGTLISCKDASVSAVTDELPLPLREEAPPSEVRVTVDRVDAREEPSKINQMNP